MKSKLREKIKELRKNVSADEVYEKSIKASENFFQSNIYKQSRCLMLYSPLGNEVGTEAIIDRAFADGKKVAFPVTDTESGSITPFYAQENTSFKKGGFSVKEPQNTEKVQKNEIDVVVVPGIVFDRKGNRVGFGKGCYDMFLKNCNAVKVGLCYDFQLAEKIPADEFDVKMDFILTEKELFCCNK